MADKFTTDDVRALTTRAEGCQSVSRILNEMPLSERVAATRAMQAQNREDRSADSRLPALEFTYGRDGNGTEFVTSGACVRDPSARFIRNTTQVYEQPTSRLSSGGAAANAADAQLNALKERERRAGT